MQSVFLHILLFGGAMEKEVLRNYIETLDAKHHLSHEQWVELLSAEQQIFADAEWLFSLARQRSREIFGNKIYTRGLIEISNYCKNNCYYCGIRRYNKEVLRYRLTPEQILECADAGYELGFRTFVLQGGEDGVFTDALVCRLVRSIKEKHPDCAITLSLGERSRESYQTMFDAGADRYLLRHETADKAHYEKLHPQEMSFENRIRCLQELKDIGYQVGCGFMVGSPYQSPEDLAKDMEFITELQPAMVGIGPFVPHHATPFAAESQGTLQKTLFLLSLLRILKPDLLLPATTALGTIDPRGREKGILAGANVVMPNLSPTSVRKQYELYDNKICTGDEAAECRGCLDRRMQSIGYELAVDRGDAPGFIKR
jgi:biotin synthase